MGGRMSAAKFASFLTARRLRAHGLILALCLWSVYLWNMSAPGLRDRAANLKGTDFLHFYTLGSLALAHRGADLYDMRAQAELAAQRVPAAAGIRYLPLYPPQVSIFFAPFARLVLSLGTDALVDPEFAPLWRMLLLRVARLPRTSQPRTNGPDSRPRLSRLLAPHRLGTNLRPRSRLLHARLLCSAQSA